MRLFIVLAALISAVVRACPDGWEDRGNACFYVSSGKGSFEQAREQCYAMGGQVAQINDFVKKTIYDTFSNIMGNFMLGLHFSPFGGWRWLDGRPLVYQNWMQGLDLDDTMDRCAMVLPTGEWTTVSCRDRLRFICEQAKPMDGTFMSMQSKLWDDDDDEEDVKKDKITVITDEKDDKEEKTKLQDGDKQYYQYTQPQYLITSSGNRVLNPAYRVYNQPAYQSYNRPAYQTYNQPAYRQNDPETIPDNNVGVVETPAPQVAAPYPYYYPYFPFSFPSFPSFPFQSFSFPAFNWDPFGISNYINGMTSSIGNHVSNAIRQSASTIANSMPPPGATVVQSPGTSGITVVGSTGSGGASSFQSSSTGGHGIGSGVSISIGPDGKPVKKEYTWTYP